LIAPLVGDGLDKGRRLDLMHEIAERGNVSERTLRRYMGAWEEGGFDALKPKQGWKRPDSGLGDSFERLVDAAIELRRESPSRSVADIIKILELEGAVEPGAVARSTLQRHLAAKGYAASQMRMYTSKGAAARRFQKEHRNQLWQSDIKFGAFVTAEGGRKKQTYLIAWIDDSKRFIVDARFYLSQTEDDVEDSLRRAIQKYGVPDGIFTDNGGQYKSKHIAKICAKLGIRLLRARPYNCEAKGKIENYNKQAGKFLSEAALKRFDRLDEYNEYLRYWVDEYYQKHSCAPLGGISPATAYGTDVRPLKFVSAELLRDAFLRTDTRKVDKTGCISFGGDLYEVGLAYVGREVEIFYDPSWTEELEVVHEHSKPFMAKKLVIGANCGVKRGLPEHMQVAPPETSRMLDALKKEFEANRPASEIATMFKGFWERGNGDV
jgi:transposase InsO family protein